MLIPQVIRQTCFLLSMLIPLLLLTTALTAQETIQFKLDALAKNTNALKEKERINTLSKIYMDYQLQTYPEFGTSIGKPTDNTKWTDLSLAAIEQRKNDISLFLNAVRSINPANLDAADRLNYSLLKYTVELDKEGETFQSELMPIDQMSGYHQQIMQVANATTFTTQKDVDDFLSRLQKIPVLVDQLIVLMDEGIKKNITQSKTTLTGVPEQIQNIIGNDPAKSPLLKGLTAYLAKQPDEQKALISKAAVSVISEKVNPSLLKLKSYIEKTYLPKAKQTIALNGLPDGENWYNYNRLVATV